MNVKEFDTGMHGLPLKDMGPELLLIELLRINPDLMLAAHEAAYLHRNDTRGPRRNLPRDPYICHPYRVALRIARWGVEDFDILRAAILHDVYEDHADEMKELYSPLEPLESLYAAYGPGVRDIVFMVSNPVPEDGSRLPLEQYHAHVLEAIKDPRAFVVKFSDWVDNALSLQHTPGKWRGKLARRYLPLAEPFGKRLLDADVKAVLGPGSLYALEAFVKGLPNLVEFSREGE